MENRSTLNAAIKGRAKQIFKDNMATIVMVAIVLQIISSLVSYLKSGNIFASLAGTLIGVVAEAGAFCFYFRAFNKGVADIKDTYELFTYQSVQKKIISLFIRMTIINFGITAVTGVLIFIPLINIIAMIVAIVISLLLRIVYSLMVINTEYPTEYYLKGSAKYMKPYLVNYILFVLGIVILPAIGISILSMFGTIGSYVGSILNAFVNGFVGLCSAGYIASIVPDEWYSGMARF